MAEAGVSLESPLEVLAAAFHRTMSQEARSWLAERGIRNETIERYGLGYAERQKIGFKDRRALEDHFAGRLIIPVRAETGQVIDLVGISMTGEEPVYKNVQGVLPLFGEEQLHDAPGEDRPVFLCEDPVDALFLLQQGRIALSSFGGERFLPEWTGRFKDREVILAFKNDPLSARHQEWTAMLLARSSERICLLNLPDGIRSVSDLHRMGEGGTALLDELVQRACRDGRFRRFVTDRPYLPVFFQEFTRRHQGPRPGVATGWPELDELLNGGLREGLYLLAGRPAAGKSSWLRQLADQLGSGGAPVLHASWELSAFELWAKSLARKLTVPVDDIFLGRADPARVEAANREYEATAGRVWTIEAGMEEGTDWLLRHVRQSFYSLGAAPVVLVDSVDRILPRRDQQGHTLDPLRDLRQLARTFSCPVVCSVSLASRAQGEIPEDLDALEAAVDVMMLLEPRGQEREPAAGDAAASTAEERPLRLRLSKNRNGPIGSIPFTFLPRFAAFRRG